ncbi:MAG TPA: hypothetical protein DDX98_11605 [Bacteroidales bacterium]|jgi:hypothetical protein|nr:hypothetical protein [Bacteroidales bacterium]
MNKITIAPLISFIIMQTGIGLYGQINYSGQDELYTMIVIDIVEIKWSTLNDFIIGTDTNKVTINQGASFGSVRSNSYFRFDKIDENGRVCIHYSEQLITLSDSGNNPLTNEVKLGVNQPFCFRSKNPSDPRDYCICIKKITNQAIATK